MQIIGGQKVAKALIASAFHPLHFLGSPQIQTDAFDAHHPLQLFELSSAVEAEEDGMGEVGPLLAWFAALEAESVGLDGEKMGEWSYLFVLVWLHVHLQLYSLECPLFPSGYKLVMNLKIDRVLPYPPSLAQPYIFTFLPALKALLLYPPPPPQEKQEEPNKKKFAFKANSNAAPTVEEVFIFEFNKSGWRTQQTKGKFPTRRENPAVACMGPCLMLYGGRQINPSKQVNDLYCLNLNTWQWKKLFAMEAPTPSPNPLAFAINDESLLVVGKELWVFSAKGVNWQLQKGDLPGGIWEKVQGSQLSFELRSSTKINNDLVVFGWDGRMKAVSINLQSKAVTTLSIEGEMTGKGESCHCVNTSQGKGIMVDGANIGHFILEATHIEFREWSSSDQVTFDRIIPVEMEGNQYNYGISTKKQLVMLEVMVDKQQEQQELPNTTRQLLETDCLRSSIIEKNVIEESPMPRSSVKEEQASASLVKHLGPLLAGEWMKRRILQSKGKLLEESIKKAERMVLMLCWYGGEEEKRIHINKVRKIRQNLSQTFSRETYFRKEMEERPGENALRQFALREYGEINAKFMDFDQEP